METEEGYPVKQACLGKMFDARFSPSLRLKSFIWAAKEEDCPKCKAKAYHACENMTQRQQGWKTHTKWPHEERVNWTKLLEALTARGY